MTTKQQIHNHHHHQVMATESITPIEDTFDLNEPSRRSLDYQLMTHDSLNPIGHHHQNINMKNSHHHHHHHHSRNHSLDHNDDDGDLFTDSVVDTVTETDMYHPRAGAANNHHNNNNSNNNGNDDNSMTIYDHNGQAQQQQQKQAPPHIFKNHYERVQWFIWNTLEQEHFTIVGTVVNVAILCLIFATITGFILSTDQVILEKNVWLDWTIFVLEDVATVIFLVEYVLRLFACTVRRSKYARHGGVLGRIRFFFSIWSIIDLLSVLPSLLSMIVSLVFHIKSRSGVKSSRDNTIIKELVSLRILRLFRLLKAEKYFNGWGFIRNVLVKKRMDLITSFFINFVLILATSTILYYVENASYIDPVTGLKGNPNFRSIPKCMYYSLLTLSTVGQGDMYPVTPGGRVVACMCAISAISAFAIPSSILSSGFIEEVQLRKERKQRQRKEKEIEMKEMARLEQAQNSRISMSIDFTSLPHSKVITVGNMCIHTCPHCNQNSVVITQNKL